ncbi:MAG TPA: PD-(D/E)XK nuclease family protein [Chthoniobacterales bacterium]|jgi:hypothetical protein|nr:PD-(D/E)XK nuclease family protein [Chthoniobacterales bacterium]
MPRRKSEPAKRAVSLHIGSSFPAAWESVVLPWFQGAALASLQSSAPVAVVTPFPSSAAFLRAKLLENSVSLLGVRFLTPPRLRELLLADGAATVPLREHLRLLLAAAAESVATSEDNDLALIAKSISRAPDNLLRVFDEMGAAGWNFDQTETPAPIEIINGFQDLVRSCDFQLVHEADRAARDKSAAKPPRFSHLLLTGFTAAYWQLWPLLQSAILSSRNGTVVLEYPRDSTRAADEAWIGSWEQEFGAATPFTSQTDRIRPFADLIQATDVAVDSPSREESHFFVGLNATEQARAIFAAALEFLAEPSCSRLGIFFPRAGALSRLVSELFTRAGLPHNDGIGHLAPGEFEEPAWNAWLELQAKHQLEPLLRFFEANPKSLDGLAVPEVRDILRDAYGKILIDDIDVLREFCARSGKERPAKAARLLGSIEFLPSGATLKTFLAQTKAIFTPLKWNSRWTAIDQFARDWSSKVSLEFSRAIYLRWLTEILDSFEIDRATEGDHRYSRVHLLSYAEAEQHEWSHLILAGLNQGEWPQPQTESGFLPDSQIANLNARATGRGKQGEGHAVLEKGKTFLLSAQGDRQIALRQFSAALESAEHGLALTASLHQDSAPERFWNPSELFGQIYFATHRAPLSQDAMLRLREQTCFWLKEQRLIDSPPPPNSDAAQTRVAYDIRRRAETAFGEYEFALRKPVDREITLRVTEWERAIKAPALIWMKKHLGVESQEPDLNQWNLATGIWVHDWLASIAGVSDEEVFVSLPSPDEIRERIARQAGTFRAMVAELCAACGRTIPDWWMSGWGNASALADFLGSKLTESSDWSQMAAEWRLDSRQVISLDGEKKLRVHGRIDLILAQKKPNGPDFSGTDLWIVDYKTGNTKTLAITGSTPQSQYEKVRKKLVEGDAIQLGLYGLAARARGAGDVRLSILSQRTNLERMQLGIDTLAEHSDFWSELYRMQETGIFGLRGWIRNEFGFNPDYPLAMLPIDKEFLDEKWVQTHPAFAADEDDRS